MKRFINALKRKPVFEHTDSIVFFFFFILLIDWNTILRNDIKCRTLINLHRIYIRKISQSQIMIYGINCSCYMMIGKRDEPIKRRFVRTKKKIREEKKTVKQVIQLLTNFEIVIFYFCCFFCVCVPCASMHAYTFLCSINSQWIRAITTNEDDDCDRETTGAI